MCLILLAVKAHSRYPFVLASNRDEFRDRSTDPAHFWEDCPQILAGRDRSGNGTWLGVSLGGRVAGLTNIRNPREFSSFKPSRGGLVSSFLAREEAPASFLESKRQGDYNPFNLILGELEEPFFFSSKEGELVGIEPGIHGLSNASLDTPWPKVLRGKAGMAEILEQEDIRPDDFMPLLQDRSRPDDRDLPDTGVGLELERFLAPIFISGQSYGTRSSTVILADSRGTVRFHERTYDGGTQNGAPWAGAPVREFSFSL